MVRPDIVVFDLGKVLLDFDYAIAAGRIAAQGKLAQGFRPEAVAVAAFAFAVKPDVSAFGD